MALFLLAAGSAAAADVVLVLENSPGMGHWLSQTAVPRLLPGDAVALLSFDSRPKLRQALTADPAKLSRAVRSLHETGRGIRVPGAQPARGAAVHAAIAAAAGLLGPKGGRIVLLFGSEERTGKPPVAELHRTLASRRVRLDVAAVSRRVPLAPPARDAQTPPTVPGRYPPVNTESLPLPEATRKALEPLCGATGGRATSGVWDLPAVLAK